MINQNKVITQQSISFQTFKQLFAASAGHRVIRLIPFHSFKQLGTFPRFPDNRDLTISLMDIDEQTYNESLFIFISHCWLRGWSGAVGWDGRPHPDNAEGGKYALCVEGIDKVLQTLVSEMKGCYLWLDFGCIDQDGNPADELQYLDKIVQVCDLLLTPIVDENHASWTIPTTLTPMEGYYVDYQSPAWKEGPYAYLNRGWCRVEMFYGSNIPLIEDSEERRGRMKAGLLYHRSEGRRPHLLYGSKQQATFSSVYILPPLQNSYFKKYNPIEGHVTKESDKVNISNLIKDLEPYMKTAKVGYEGETDARGMMHGKGKYTYDNGDVYEGDWKNDNRHGKGKYTYASGGVYEGDYKDDKRHGKGKFTYASGSVYEGDWKDSKHHGKGKYTYASGDVYEGDYQNGKMQGKGKCTYASGAVYEGDRKDGKHHGKGKFTYADGGVYEGDWKDDKRHGIGKFTHASGDIYKGDYKDDKKHGKGKLLRSNGIVFLQGFDNDQLISEKEQKSSTCTLS